MEKKLVAGAGSALVDLILEETDDFLEKMGSPKGGMTLVDIKTISGAAAASHSRPEIVPGGSACNTLVGISALGGETRMIGKCGKDELAETFTEGLKRAGVQGQLSFSETPTGRVLSVVTPDAQRTMFTFLGAAAELSAGDVLDEYLHEAAIVHLEGYQLFNREVTEAVIAGAHKAGAMLSLDLASFEVVGAVKEYLETIIPAHVDILIANEDEARAYTGEDEKTSLEIFAGLSEIAVVKMGKKGSLAARGNERITTAPGKAKAVDTTGAGDLWASGFLYGLTRDFSLQNAADLGAQVAEEVVQVMGAVIPKEGWARILGVKKEIEEGN